MLVGEGVELRSMFKPSIFILFESIYTLHEPRSPFPGVSQRKLTTLSLWRSCDMLEDVRGSETPRGQVPNSCSDCHRSQQQINWEADTRGDATAQLTSTIYHSSGLWCRFEASLLLPNNALLLFSCLGVQKDALISLSSFTIP
jgi:hypothetical protein